MTHRSFWNGFLTLSLVTCPVQLQPARTAEGMMGFQTVSRKCGDRVESCLLDADTGVPLPDHSPARGYSLDDGISVNGRDDEMEEDGPGGVRTIAIERFVPAEGIGWIWLDRPHFVRASDRVGDEGLAVIRDAMTATGTAALSRIVLYGREHAVALLPRDNGVMLWTLRFGEEIHRRAGPAARETDIRVTRTIGKMIAEHMAEWASSRAVPDRSGTPVASLAERSAAPTCALQPSRLLAATGTNVVSLGIPNGRRKG